MCRTDRLSHGDRRFLKLSQSSGGVRKDGRALIRDSGDIPVRVRGVHHVLDPGVRQGDRVGSTSHPSPVIGLNSVEVVVRLGVGDGVLVAVGDDLVGINLTVGATSSSVGDSMGGVCDGDMVVRRGGNNRRRMGNNGGANMGNDCRCVMVVNSQSSCLGNRGVHGNGRGSVNGGVASDPMVEHMAHPVVDMAHSVGDNSRRCMHSGMPDPVSNKWSNGNSRGN